MRGEVAAAVTGAMALVGAVAGAGVAWWMHRRTNLSPRNVYLAWVLSVAVAAGSAGLRQSLAFAGALVLMLGVTVAAVLGASLAGGRVGGGRGAAGVRAGQGDGVEPAAPAVVARPRAGERVYIAVAGAARARARLAGRGARAADDRRRARHGAARRGPCTCISSARPGPGKTTSARRVAARAGPGRARHGAARAGSEGRSRRSSAICARSPPHTGRPFVLFDPFDDAQRSLEPDLGRGPRRGRGAARRAGRGRPGLRRQPLQPRAARPPRPGRRRAARRRPLAGGAAGAAADRAAPALRRARRARRSDTGADGELLRAARRSRRRAGRARDAGPARWQPARAGGRHRPGVAARAHARASRGAVDACRSRWPRARSCCGRRTSRTSRKRPRRSPRSPSPTSAPPPARSPTDAQWALLIDEFGVVLQGRAGERAVALMQRARISHGQVARLHAVDLRRAVGDRQRAPARRADRQLHRLRRCTARPRRRAATGSRSCSAPARSGSRPTAPVGGARRRRRIPPARRRVPRAPRRVPPAQARRGGHLDALGPAPASVTVTPGPAPRLADHAAVYRPLTRSRSTNCSPVPA